MATRMQQRRGTAAQWVSTNSGNGPILNAGEIGYETDTNKFKIGDGTNHWINLDYFIDASSTVNPSFGSSITFEGATANNFETTLAITDPTADRTITFPDATGTVALTSDIAELSQDAIDAVLVAGTGLTKIYNDGANTLTVAVDTSTIQARVTDVSDTEIGYLNGVTSAIQTQMDAKAPLASPTFTGTVTLPANTISQSMMADDSVGTNEIGGLAVTTAKIADLNVTEGKIADGAVTSVKIANDTIVNADINSAAAIDQSKIANLTTDLAAKLALAGGTMTGAIAMGTNKITGLGTPTDAADAATKAYVDAVTEGLHIHEAAIAATTANVALSSALENGDTLDGITLATGNRILVKNQSTASENGIYVVQASGQPTRATDFDTASEVDSGDFIFVYSGTVNGGTGWVQTNRPATIGTDAIAFTQFSGAGTYSAGNGLTLTGTTFTIDTSITQARVADVSDTEIGYLNGVTSAIQTQIDSKLASSTASSTYAPLANPTFTGTVTLPTGTVTSGMILDGTIANGDINASAAIALSKLASGTSGQIIVANSSGVPTWVSETGDVTISDTGVTAIASGVIVDADVNASAAIAQSKISGLTTDLAAKIAKADITAKGVILVGTGSGTYAAQSVGTNGQVLTANSAQADGVEWTSISSDARPDIFMLMGA
jgi:hypothetical protein